MSKDKKTPTDSDIDEDDIEVLDIDEEDIYVKDNNVENDININKEQENEEPNNEEQESAEITNEESENVEPPNESEIEIIDDDDDIEIINDEDKPYIVKKTDDNINDDETEQKSQKMKAFAKEFFSWVKMLIIAVCIAVFINFVILFNGTVPSGSMSPTIEYPSRIIGFRLEYLFSEPERGDIIIFKYPDDPTQNFVKRIIGLPGETVEIIDGEVYISVDGEMIEDPLDESYLSETPTGNFGPYEVPEGYYFVMGDNRNSSWDSRYWDNTFVSEDAILAKALVQYWPDFWLLK